MKLIGAIVLSIAASQTQAIELRQLLRDATQYDAQYQQAFNQWKAAVEQIPQARSALLPNLEVVAGKSHHPELGTSRTNASGGAYDSDYYGLSARQVIYRPKDFMALKQAKLAVSQAEVTYQMALSKLIQRTADAFFSVLLLESDIRVLELQKKASQQLLDYAQLRFEVGDAGINDSFAAQARLDSLGAQLAESVNALELARQSLALITGVFPVVEIRTPLEFTVKTANHIRLMQLTLNEVLVLSEKNNANVISKRLAFGIAEQEIYRHKITHSPTLDLVANYQNQSSDNIINQNVLLPEEAASIELQFRLPLYQGGNRSSKLRQASYNRYAAKDALIYATRQAQLDTTKAYQGVTTSFLQIKAHERAIESSRRALRAAERGMELGSRTTLDVLDAQDILFSAQHDLSVARFRLMQNVFSLYDQTGLLSLASVDELLTEVSL